MKRFFLSLLAMTVSLSGIFARDYSKSELDAIYAASFGSGSIPNRVSVHDPSIVIGYELNGVVSGVEKTGSKKVYCIFGSHMAWAKSYDLQNWTTFSNNITTANCNTIFSQNLEWAKLGNSSYDLTGNLWAPDIVWNDTMNKWCMYMSVNSDHWYSQIVLLTADNLTGDWTYVGPVVYSGFTNAAQGVKSDLYSVLDLASNATFPSRYNINRNGNHTYGTNAIDPCVLYDTDGSLWMSYGSWFGGLYILKLDKSTGLRDLSRTYSLNDGTAENAKEDPYQGIKIAGGNHMSGEASYIKKIGNYYYLFVTYGGLAAKGGYNMRVFRSSSITGPYTDSENHDARYLAESNNTGVGNINGKYGHRLMSYYKWNHMEKGYTAQGHNSCYVNEDGQIFLVYHTRFNDGTEGHQVRVHQMFETANGLTAAPFEYRGESLKAEGYTKNDVIGTYGIIYHGYGTDYKNLVCAQEEEITLNADGTVSGARSGSWSMTDNSNTLNIRISSVNFTAVLIEQQIEETKIKTLCFTGNGNSNNLSLWGFKKGGVGQMYSDEITLAYNAKKIVASLGSVAYKGTSLDFSSEGYMGCKLSWEPADLSLISADGKISSSVSKSTNTSVKITMQCGDAKYVYDYAIAISPNDVTSGYAINVDQLQSFYSTSSLFDSNSNSVGISAETGVSFNFTISGYTSDWDPVMTSSDGKYIMYLSVLHYENNDYYEAAATASSEAKATGTAAYQLFFNNSYKVTVSFNPDGTIEYYRNGVLMLTYAANTEPSWNGGTKYYPSQIASQVIEYYKNGQLSFKKSLSNVLVGTSVKYQKAASTPIRTATTDEIYIRKCGKNIIINGAPTDSIVEIYSLTGSCLFCGISNEIEVNYKGIVIVKVGNTTRKILL